MRTHQVALATLVLACSWTSARADDGGLAACLEAHMDGQRARSAGKLLTALERFTRCADSACPVGPRVDCAQWLSDVQQTIPSVAISVRGDDGQDHVDATLFLDGQGIGRRLDGRSIPVDPGEHTARVVLSDGRSKEERFVAREGEKSRAITIAFAPPVKLPPFATSRPVSPWTYVLAGVSAVGLGIFTGFGVDGKARESSLRADPCHQTRTCTPARVDAMYRSYTVADISLVVSLVAASGATIVYLLRPSVQERGAPQSALQPSAPTF